MRDIVELRSELAGVFNGLKDGSLGVQAAKEMNNAAGKMINSAKAQLEYAALRKEKPTIKFLSEK